MAERIKRLVQAVRNTLSGAGGIAGAAANGFRRSGALLLAVCAAGGVAYGLATHPPLARLEPGNVGIRINQLTGSTTTVRDGAVFMFPGVHALRQVSLLDQVYRPNRSDKAPFQSVEGLALGVDLSVRYALDPGRVAGMAQSLPPDINGAIVEPAVQGVIYKVFTRYTVREIFRPNGRRSSRRSRRSSNPSWRPTASRCAASPSARSRCRRSTRREWRNCWRKNWKPRRCAIRWS